MSNRKKLPRRKIRRDKNSSTEKELKSSFREKKDDSLLAIVNHPTLKKIFWSLFGLTVLLLVFESYQLGIPGDEPIDAEYGQAALHFYQSLGEDTTFKELTVYNQNFPLQKYYGAGFEMPVTLLTKLVPAVNPFKIRHMIVAISGAFLILFIGLISVDLLGWLAGIVSMLFTLASPTLVGHMLFNSKDIPFTLGLIISIYYMLRISRQWPGMKNLDLLGMLTGIAMATSVRIGGLLAVFYLAILLTTKLLVERKTREAFLNLENKTRAKSLLLLAGSALLGVIIGLLFYPNLFQAPFQHIAQALSVASDFPVRILMLFEGKMIYSTDLPRYFLLKSLIISLPIFMLIGAILILFTFRSIINHIGIVNFIFLLFTILFPLVYIIWSDAAIYNGWRHVMFFYPTLVVLTSISVTLILVPFRWDMVRTSVLVLFGVLIAKVLFWQLNNYPYQYAYYNELTGGSEAYKKYDSDYQQLAVSEGVDWLLENEDDLKAPNRAKKIIASNNGHALNHYYDTTALNIEFTFTGMKDLRNSDWDYAVMSELFVTPEVRRLALPPTDNVHTVAVNNNPLAYVIKRKNKYNFEGLTALQKGDVGLGLELLQKANQEDPKNFNAWLNIGLGHSLTGNGAEIIRYVTPYLRLYPTDWIAIYLMGVGYYYQRDYANGERYLLQARKLKPSDPSIIKRLTALYQESGQLEKLRALQQQNN